jgi:hypothetical protein
MNIDRRTTVTLHRPVTSCWAIVSGGRDFKDRAMVERVLDEIRPEVIYTGAARGVDEFARDWANDRGVPYFSCPAQWNQYGKKAGPLRNTWMLRYGRADTLIAFPGGKGTQNMWNQAVTAGISRIRINEDGEIRYQKED